MACTRRLHLLSKHIANMSTLHSLPKSSVFTSRLPPDPEFPTPSSSAAAPLDNLGPRMVKEALYTFVRPTPSTKKPELLAVSPAALRDLGLAQEETEKEEFANLVAGNWDYTTEPLPSPYPWAQCYGGWQFGQWAGQLGDGRAISLFEATNPDTGRRYEVQLKGAGKTPYSRFADGKAVLRSSIREFLVSEYLNAIGIPTTRALSLSLIPGRTAARERLEPCAIVARMAESWVRIGTFDLLRWRGDRKRLRVLADYTIEEILKMPEVEGNRYEAMYREIVKRNAKTTALWQVHGFMNGVLNTDNTSIMGLSIDFGPFAFMDTYEPTYTPNHDDHMLRYCYKNQPTVIWWNLVRLAEDIAELFAVEDPDDKEFVENGIHEDKADALVKKAEAIIEDVGEEYKRIFTEEYKERMVQKLGFKSLKESDMDEILTPCLDLMENRGLDFHHFFRRLAETPINAALEKPEGFLPSDSEKTKTEIADVRAFLEKYQKRLEEEAVSDEERIPKMKGLNPKFVPKNWVLDEIIERVEKKGDRRVLGQVMKLVLDPFADSWDDAPDAERWCGEVPKLKRALQCSCSS